MVSVRKKHIGGKSYYYLEHTIREEGRVKKKEKYLGPILPNDIELQKKDFLVQIYRDRWEPILVKIKDGYDIESKSMPTSLRDKQAHIFSVRFTYDTNRIEGSTLTLRETADLIDEGITPSNKPIDDVKEAEAHERLFQETLSDPKDLTRQKILKWHYKLFKDTKRDIAGTTRQHQVAISGSDFMPPSPIEVELLLGEFFKWYNRGKKKLNPVELSALCHLKFVTIHPFADGNGRISRLIMNFILNKNRYPLLNIPYTKRTSYYNALERAQTKNQDHVFTNWLIKRYIKDHGKYAKK